MDNIYINKLQNNVLDISKSLSSMDIDLHDNEKIQNNIPTSKITPIDLNIKLLKSLENTAFDYFYTENLDKALNTFEKCFEHVISLNNDGINSTMFHEYFKKIIGELNNKALNYIQKGNVDKAMKILLKCKMYTQSQGGYLFVPEIRSEILNSLSCCYRRLSKLEKSLDYLYQGLEIISELTAFEQQGITHINLCAVLSQLEKHEDALTHAKKAVISCSSDLTQYNKLNPDRTSNIYMKKITMLGLAHHNLAIEEDYCGNYNIALQEYKNAYSLIEEHQGTNHKLAQSFKDAYDKALELDNSLKKKAAKRRLQKDDSKGISNTKRTKKSTKKKNSKPNKSHSLARIYGMNDISPLKLNTKGYFANNRIVFPKPLNFISISGLYDNSNQTTIYSKAVENTKSNRIDTMNDYLNKKNMSKFQELPSKNLFNKRPHTAKNRLNYEKSPLRQKKLSENHDVIANIKDQIKSNVENLQMEIDDLEVLFPEDELENNSKQCKSNRIAFLEHLNNLHQKSQINTNPKRTPVQSNQSDSISYNTKRSSDLNKKQQLDDEYSTKRDSIEIKNNPSIEINPLPDDQNKSMNFLAPKEKINRNSNESNEYLNPVRGQNSQRPFSATYSTLQAEEYLERAIKPKINEKNDSNKDSNKIHPRIKLTPPETKALIKIQSSGRGYLARTNFKKNKNHLGYKTILKEKITLPLGLDSSSKVNAFLTVLYCNFNNTLYWVAKDFTKRRCYKCIQVLDISKEMIDTSHEQLIKSCKAILGSIYGDNDSYMLKFKPESRANKPAQENQIISHAKAMKNNDDEDSHTKDGAIVSSMPIITIKDDKGLKNNNNNKQSNELIIEVIDEESPMKMIFPNEDKYLKQIEFDYMNHKLRFRLYEIHQHNFDNINQPVNQYIIKCYDLTTNHDFSKLEVSPEFIQPFFISWDQKPILDLLDINIDEYRLNIKQRQKQQQQPKQESQLQQDNEDEMAIEIHKIEEIISIDNYSVKKDSQIIEDDFPNSTSIKIYNDDDNLFNNKPIKPNFSIIDSGIIKSNIELLSSPNDRNTHYELKEIRSPDRHIDDNDFLTKSSLKNNIKIEDSLQESQLKRVEVANENMKNDNHAKQLNLTPDNSLKRSAKDFMNSSSPINDSVKIDNILTDKLVNKNVNMNEMDTKDKAKKPLKSNAEAIIEMNSNDKDIKLEAEDIQVNQTQEIDLDKREDIQYQRKDIQDKRDNNQSREIDSGSKLNNVKDIVCDNQEKNIQEIDLNLDKKGDTEDKQYKEKDLEIKEAKQLQGIDFSKMFIHENMDMQATESMLQPNMINLDNKGSQNQEAKELQEVDFEKKQIDENDDMGNNQNNQLEKADLNKESNGEQENLPNNQDNRFEEIDINQEDISKQENALNNQDNRAEEADLSREDISKPENLLNNQDDKVEEADLSKEGIDKQEEKSQDKQDEQAQKIDLSQKLLDAKEEIKDIQDQQAQEVDLSKKEADKTEDIKGKQSPKTDSNKKVIDEQHTESIPNKPGEMSILKEDDSSIPIETSQQPTEQSKEISPLEEQKHNDSATVQSENTSPLKVEALKSEANNLSTNPINDTTETESKKNTIEVQATNQIPLEKSAEAAKIAKDTPLITDTNSISDKTSQMDPDLIWFKENKSKIQAIRKKLKNDKDGGITSDKTDLSIAWYYENEKKIKKGIKHVKQAKELKSNKAANSEKQPETKANTQEPGANIIATETNPKTKNSAFDNPSKLAEVTNDNISETSKSITTQPNEEAKSEEIDVPKKKKKKNKNPKSMQQSTLTFNNIVFQVEILYNPSSKEIVISYSSQNDPNTKKELRIPLAQFNIPNLKKSYFMKNIETILIGRIFESNGTLQFK